MTRRMRAEGLGLPETTPLKELPTTDIDAVLAAGLAFAKLIKDDRSRPPRDIDPFTDLHSRNGRHIVLGQRLPGPFSIRTGDVRVRA